MWKFLISSLGTVTLRQTSITFFGTIINGILGAIFYFLIARILGPANFGILILAITVLTLVNDISDLGINTGLINFVGKYIHTDQEKALRFIKLALEVKVIMAILIVVTGWFISPYLAQFLFQKPELINPLRWALLGVGFMLLLSFTLSSLQAIQKYLQWSLIQIGTNGIRLIVVIFLWFLGYLNLQSTLIIYILLPLAGFLGSMFFLPKGFLKVPKAYLVQSDLFHYSKWVALFTLVSALSSRMDTFLTARLLSNTELGFYSAANQLVTIVPQLVVALGTVIGPKMAGFKNNGEMVIYLKKTQLLVLGLSGIGLLSIPLVLFLVPILYGPAYAAAVPPIFLILMLGMLLFLISVPVHNAIIYYFGYPKLFSYVSVGHLSIVGILGWILIPSFGVIGAAETVLVGNFFNLLVPLAWVFMKLKK